MTFYRFRQNNSRGMFVINDQVTINVLIEADNADEANNKAEAVGLYFSGCDTGYDCKCCGDRWTRAEDDDPDNSDTPTIYGEPLEDHQEDWCEVGQPYVHIYYKDGSKVTHIKKGEE